MKKIIVSIILSLFAFSTASAAGVKVGVAGNVGLFGATGKESQTGNSVSDPTENRKRSEILGIAYSSIFLEKTLGDRISIGIDYVPSGIESETTETAKGDKRTDESDAVSYGENKVQVDFEDLTTLYLTLNLTDNLYGKVGVAHVDVITNEAIATGASYGNTDMDATVIGFGYDTEFGNGMFVRTEANYMDFDGTSLTSGDNTISISSLTGVTAKLAIGKSF